MANSRNIKLGENNQSALNLLNVVTRIFEEKNYDIFATFYFCL